MASPFPGMDPYLERPDLWPEFHNRYAIYLCDALQPQLPPNYVARIELRIYTERDSSSWVSGPRVPDLELVRIGAGRSSQVAENPEQAELGRGHWFAAARLERREAYVVIQNLDAGKLVTALELLSPSNKRSGEGREKYLSNQEEFLRADANLIEIDLLRDGRHTAAVAPEQVETLRPFDYLTCTYRTAPPVGFWVDTWRLSEPLPVLSVPLERGVPDIRVDFKPLFDQAYTNGAFQKLIDYRTDPIPTLAPDDAARADPLLREAGLRGTPSA